MLFEDRFKELILSVYLYNEWRGFLQLERDLIPEIENDSRYSSAFVASVKKHAADERKHYFLFKDYFRRRGIMPFAVGRAVGYFDWLVQGIVGRGKKSSSALMLHNPKRFANLCRAVVVTEIRGIQQVESILRWPSVKRDPHLRRIFSVIRRDEPSHFKPYENWLLGNGHALPSFGEKIWDLVIHYSIAVLVIPTLFMNLRLARLKNFPA